MSLKLAATGARWGALLFLSTPVLAACSSEPSSPAASGGSVASGGGAGAGGSLAGSAGAGGAGVGGGVAGGAGVGGNIVGGAGGSGGAAPPSGGAAGSASVQLRECTLTAPTHWAAGVYVVNTCNLAVAAPLTVDPGVIVKFGAGFQLKIEPSGKLLANGTEAQPIIFTSLRDDANGGDTNGDGPSVASRNDWGCQGDCGAVDIQGTGSILEHVKVLYGTNGVYIQADSLQIIASTFAYQHTYGLVVDGRFPVGQTQLTKSAFFGNDGYPLRLGKAVFLDASNVFHDPANPEIKNTKQCVELDSDIDQLTVFGSTEIGLLFSGHRISSEVLAPAGLIFKAQNAAIYLDAAGTFFNGLNAIFTSYKDDSVGGDCTGDGATVPAVGDWEGLWIDDGSKADYAAPVDTVRYAAKSGTMALH